MASPEDDVNASPDDADGGSGLGDMGSELQAALGDLLGGDDDADDGDSLDLHALEDAVAELGIDIVADGPEEPAAPARPASPGLDLTELPPPPGAPAAGPPPARKLPPLGQASADDLFGPLDDDDWAPSDLAEGSVPAPPPPPAAEASAGGEDDEPFAEEPVSLPASEPPPPAADPTSDEIVAYAAHRGRLGGVMGTKARKLFGR